jgi:hypothetical protein
MQQAVIEPAANACWLRPLNLEEPWGESFAINRVMERAAMEGQLYLYKAFQFLQGADRGGLNF